jgi:hypothetical protein
VLGAWQTFKVLKPRRGDGGAWAGLAPIGEGGDVASDGGGGSDAGAPRRRPALGAGSAGRPGPVGRGAGAGSSSGASSAMSRRQSVLESSGRVIAASYDDAAGEGLLAYWAVLSALGGEWAEEETAAWCLCSRAHRPVHQRACSDSSSLLSSLAISHPLYPCPRAVYEWAGEWALRWLPLYFEAKAALLAWLVGGVAAACLGVGRAPLSPQAHRSNGGGFSLLSRSLLRGPGAPLPSASSSLRGGGGGGGGGGVASPPPLSLDAARVLFTSLLHPAMARCDALLDGVLAPAVATVLVR